MVFLDRDGARGTLLRARGLAVFRGTLESDAAQDMLSLLGLLSEKNQNPVRVAETFGRLWEELALEQDLLLPDAWQSHLISRILDDENAFSLGSEKGSVSSTVEKQTRRELRTLEELFDLDAMTLLRAIEEAFPGLREIWVPWSDPGMEGQNGGSPRRAIALALSETTGWGEKAKVLAKHFKRHGAGVFGRYSAFRWRRGRLYPVEEPDPVRLEDLVGYEEVRAPLLSNTNRFLAGVPAHHALLYGLPGTGKSSTVKAILNGNAGRGLRIVEMAKEDLGELPAVLSALRGRGLHFILFVDDLSFEEHEVEYKALKALLEGSVEEPPRNVRVYATSNRRNLIRESFSEREDGDFLGDDVHPRDTMQEKLSLAARFGLRVTFPTPDQQEYLEIVSGLTRRRGLRINGEELRERALLWDRWHAGRSGRTARQFVDELEAELSGGRI